MTEPLRIAFEAAEDLQREFAQNLSKGGAVVRTSAEPELRSIVEVELEASFASKRWVFEAEVVALLPGTGVAVQFVKPASELRVELGDLLGALHDGAPAAPSAEPDAFAREELDIGPEDEGLEVDLDELDPGALSLHDPGPEPALEPAPEPMAEPFAEPGGNGTDPLADPLASVGERRRGQRSTARVAARVEAPHVSVAGRTRDISETGVLISADGSDLPVGKVVRLELSQPGTGETFEVRGKVCRHVHSEGTVAAVGIAFDPEPEQEAALAVFVRAVKAVAEQRVASGITGRIEELGMSNLLQMLGASSPVGTLTASSGEEEGVIAFEGGSLRYARLGATKGIKALVRMLGWADGDFAFQSHVDALDDEPEAIPLATALLEAVRQMDEAAAPGLTAPAPGATFSVDTAALARSGGLDKTSEAVVELAMAGFTVRRILDVIPESDAEIHRAIQSLVEDAILEARPG